MSIYIVNKYMCADTIVETCGASGRYYFSTNFKFYTYFLYRAALKFSSTPTPPFTEAATGASEKPGCQSQETEGGGTQSSSSRVRLD